ncbi:MAG: PKD domain-containing protein [Planctomycetes bacterium]|jgi:PKD repeat protein|nr:PKD domain-containing protein [Planctomycetota bacterium]MBT6451980.1 PKD domain-containing protein [Planctomycetota bacterium]MBT6540183.1 PKD domain-containing protein [Planctomycetota bacterium]MBT6967204.1 PKD domain-containing protein [Planctomycetota bacterium]MBT7104972.1 PKD domain-containing protein [Planctomycetota bacterium]
MSRLFLALFLVLIFPQLSSAQETGQKWSYPYGEGRASLVQVEGIIAVKMIDGLEDELASLRAELRSIRGVGKVSEKNLQEYPGLWYLPLEKRVDARMQQQILAQLASATVVEFAGPVLGYQEAVMIPRPEVIVTFDGSADDEEIRNVIRQSGLRFLKEFPAIDPTYMLGFEGPTSIGFEIADALTELEEVWVAEPNFIHDLPEMATPNDPLFPDQWDMQNTGQTGGTIGADMKAAAAWDISTGSSSIVVAVIDEGVDVNHADLQANMVAGYDAVTADPTPGGIPGNANSTDGHGTCCAGIIAAVGNNGIGVAGVTWNSKIMPVRIGFGNYWTQTDWLVDGLTWPVDHGADVLSNSWGGGSASSAIQNAIAYGNTNGRGGLGCPVFFASGNDNSAVSYPALYPESIAVGASSPCDERKSPSSCDGETWWGSNYGSSLDFVAPGPLTTTVDISGSGGYSSTDYTSSFNGTSSATPHAAGAGALLLAVAPGLTHDQVRTYMRQTADDQVGPPSEDTAGFDNYMGYGRINCETLLLTVASSVAAPTNLSCSSSGADALLSWTNGESYSQVQVSRGGSVIATLSGSATSYTDSSAGVGNVSYGVRGLVGSDQSPQASCSIFLTGGATDLVWAPSAAGGAVAGGSAISAALTANGRSPLVVTTLDAVASLDAFETVWVNLGIYPSGHVLSAAEGTTLDTYLTNGVGGSFLYMEGGDTWAYDSATSVHSRFGISGLSDGTGDLSTVNGAAGTGCSLAGSSWSYTGENSWIDHLGTTGSAVVTLTNPTAAYDVGVFNDAGAYRTFGTSFEIGGLVDGASTRADLVGAILNCFTGSPPPPPPAPVADFVASPTSGEAPVAVSFSNSSTGNITGYSWNFGDGGSSTAQNPSHTYTSAGTYSVTLTATGPGGSDTASCSSCIVVTDPPPPPPVAGFTPDSAGGETPIAVSFSNSSTGDITGYSWNFGDGGSSTAVNPSHTYTSAGTYTVILTATGPGGSDTATCTSCIVVTDPPPPPPVAGFTPGSAGGEAPVTVSFSNSSTGDISGYAWDFGDGGNSTAQNPSHTYTTAGTYSVTLTVTGPGGSDTASCGSCIVVTDPPPPPPTAPVAGFTADSSGGEAPVTVSFSNSSTGDITGYSWNFGDGGSSTAQNPSHTYNSAGTYSVSLTATGPGGSDTAVCSSCIVVTDPPPPPPPTPVAGFIPNSSGGEAPVTVSFSNSSIGDITGYSWNFGDGGSSTAQNPSHTYSSAGTYTVTLTATGPGGSDTATCGSCIVVTDPPPPPPPPPSTSLYYISFLSTTTVPGLGNVRDEDIVTYDPATDSWDWYLDGSDVGIGGTDINALSVLADGSVLVSFNSGSFSLPGLTGGPSGTTVEDSDLVLFTPTTTGSSSAGSWSFYLDGSDCALTTNGEDIDGVCYLDDGTLLISTLGTARGGGPTNRDEDVMLFTPTSVGSASGGSWTTFFDGSDVGFSNSGGEDLNAISLDFDGSVLFSTQGTYSASGSSGADEDVSRFTGSFGSSTSGIAELIFDMSALGISTSADIDGISIR